MLTKVKLARDKTHWFVINIGKYEGFSLTGSVKELYTNYDLVGSKIVMELPTD